MSLEQKTLRLLLPQWQGGNNPNYYFGAELLAQIVPKGSAEMIRIPVKKDFERDLPLEDGVKGTAELLEQLKATQAVLKEKQPDKVIILGGDCSISQVPFDYLNGKYGEKLGVLWLDAHPDVAVVQDSAHDHEMVLRNLLGGGAPRFAAQVEHPLKPQQVMFAGLQYEELRPLDRAVDQLSLRYTTPQELQNDSAPILAWIAENGFEKIAIHFDLDVLSPADFRSIYPAEPYLESFGAAIGELTLKEVVRVMKDISTQTEIVGVSIAEHLPWDAINLREALSEIEIFND